MHTERGLLEAYLFLLPVPPSKLSTLSGSPNPSHPSLCLPAPSPPHITLTQKKPSPKKNPTRNRLTQSPHERIPYDTLPQQAPHHPHPTTPSKLPNLHHQFQTIMASNEATFLPANRTPLSCPPPQILAPISSQARIFRFSPRLDFGRSVWKCGPE